MGVSSRTMSTDLDACLARQDWQVQVLMALPTEAELDGPIGTLHALSAAAKIASFLPPPCVAVLRAYADRNASALLTGLLGARAGGTASAPLVVVLRRLCTPVLGR